MRVAAALRLTPARSGQAGIFGWFVLILMIGSPLALAEAPRKFATNIDFSSPEWNRDAWARMQSDLAPGKQRIGRYKGTVLAVVPGQAVQPLFGFEGFAVSRLLFRKDGNYRRLNREVVIYTDRQTGEVIDQWTNPWTDEVVDVVHVANDPFNYDIATYMVMQPEDIGGETPAAPVRVPLLLPWERLGDGTLMLATDMHLYYPNALQPDKWPRESSGPMVRVSEMFRYFVPVAELENPALTTVSWHGTWNRVTPWLPWMLMGDQPGHVLYVGLMASADSFDDVSADVLAYVRETFPEFLTAPDEDYGPSLSSIENYARSQKPAPPGSN